jgi:hypothetical protein
MHHRLSHYNLNVKARREVMTCLWRRNSHRNSISHLGHLLHHSHLQQSKATSAATKIIDLSPLFLLLHLLLLVFAEASHLVP